MIDPRFVDPFTLPSIPLDRERRSRRFPTLSCIYFALDCNKRIQYIGKAVCLRQRWQGHSRELSLLRMGQIDIAYLSAEEHLLDELEQVLIHRFKPPMNKHFSRRREVARLCELFDCQPQDLFEEEDSE